MGLLYDGRILITDASNVPQSGGKVRIYDAGTTNLSSVFSDAALSVPLTNPVVANSAGITPQIFAADGLLVDIQYLTSADASIPTRGYEDVSFLGSSTGDISRTVTGDGRFTITGSAGAVLFRVGDPSPDNTGGTLTIEGWAGTQGDTLTLDFALVNVTGRFKEQGKKLQGTVYTEATQVTAATQVDIALPNDPTGVRGYEIHIWDYSQSGNGNLQARLSYDSGATYKAGANDYSFWWLSGDTSPAVGMAGAGTGAFYTRMELASNLNGVSDQLASGWIRIITPNSGTTFTKLDSDLSGISNIGAGVIFRAAGHGRGSYGRATHLRLLMSANNFTFKYRVVALRGFGET
jgi:hypothetical protein